MAKGGGLGPVLYLNVLIVSFLVFYKVYLNFFEQDYEAVHAEQVERIEAALDGRASFSFAVVGNINNSIGIFERKIIPLLNQSGVDFIVSAGNAVSSGSEDKYRALHRTLSRLRPPYLLTFGEHEYSAFGSFRFYDHYGPYVFAFSAGNSRFIFLDSTGKTPWSWQFRWLDEVLAAGREKNTFIFVGRPVKPVDRGGILDFDDDYLIDEEIREQLADLVERTGVDAVFSANLPLFSIWTGGETSYVTTGGAGGFVLNTERSYYHYVRVAVEGSHVHVVPVRLDIGQHPVFRTLESLWFYVHSLFYVGYLNFILLVCVLTILAIWLNRTIFTERAYYPDFDLPPEPVLDRTIRVVMFTNNYLPFIGGVPIAIDRLRRALRDLGHIILIVAPRYRRTGQETAEQGGVLRLPSLWQGGKRGELNVANIFLPRIFRTVAGFRPDIVHLHHPFWLGSLGMLLARRLKVPVVFTYHTRLEEYWHAVPLPGVLFRNIISHTLVRRFCNRCDAIIVPTESVEYYLRVIGVKRPLFVQPTGIECERFQQAVQAGAEPLRHRLGIGDERVLISVSRLSREKNIDFMLDAVHLLRQRSAAPLRLLLIGEGEEREHLETRISQLGLEGIVLLAGAVRPEEIPTYYVLGDLFVFASRSETQGMVIVEAMAAGLPVVAVRSSGIDDFIRDGCNGYKTRLHHEVWAERVRELLENEDLRRRLAANARLTSEEYCMERFGREITRIYAKVLAVRENNMGDGTP